MAGKVSGSGAKKRGTYGTNAEPNVIPFIDIMLVLLIIFMVAAPIPTVDIRVDLPPPNAKERISENRPTFVGIEDTGGVIEVYVDGELTPLSQVAKTTYEHALKNNTPGTNIFKDASIYLRADQETAYANVFLVMNQIQEEGFIKVSIVAEDAQI
jgi:biopolymer transport protein ExbD